MGTVRDLWYVFIAWRYNAQACVLYFNTFFFFLPIPARLVNWIDIIFLSLFLRVHENAQFWDGPPESIYPSILFLLLVPQVQPPIRTDTCYRYFSKIHYRPRNDERSPKKSKTNTNRNPIHNISLVLIFTVVEHLSKRKRCDVFLKHFLHILFDVFFRVTVESV